MDRKMTIGLLIPDLEENYQSEIWPSIYESSKNQGINLILFVGKSIDSPYGQDSQHNVIYDLAANRDIDGLIILTGSLGNFLTNDELKLFCTKFRNIPITTIAEPVGEYPCVMADNKTGIREAVDHLVTVHGLKRIAFIKGPENHVESNLRFEAYTEALKEFGIDFDPEIVCSGNFILNDGIRAVRKLVENGAVFDAIISANDEMALGAFKELQDKGLRVPGDVALVGFDDSESVRYFNPPMTTVRQPFDDQGKKAVEYISSLVAGRKVVCDPALPSRLVVRQSCGCMPNLIGIGRKENETTAIIPEKKAKKNLNVRKEKIIGEIRQILKTDLFDPAVLLDWLFNLLDIFDNMDDPDAIKDFLFKINSLPKAIIEKIAEESLLHDILEIIKRNIKTGIDDSEKLGFIEKLFQNAHLVAGEILLRPKAYNVILIKEFVFLLNEISQSIITSFEVNELIEVIVSELPKLNIRICNIYLYKNAVERVDKMNWNIPERIELLLEFNDYEKVVKKFGRQIIYTNDFIPKSCGESENENYVIMPLLFKDEHFGFILFELGSNYKYAYDLLREQISSALKGSLLFKRQLEISDELKIALNELKESYQILENRSNSDELTGLYNRRGFLMLANHHIKLAKRVNSDFLLFYGDIDGLKSVNDNYGHVEGDFVITKTADILKDTFRDADIIARIGGDEFVAIIINTTLDNSGNIKTRLEKKIDEFNLQSCKPYKISMSCGFATFYSDAESSLDNLIEQADKMQYENKKNKKLERL